MLCNRITCCILCCQFLLHGCSPATTITVLQHRDNPLASYSSDYRRCCDSIGRHPDPFVWTWRIALYELANQEICRDVQLWNCLSGYGWQPAIQAIGPPQASEEDFRRALHECTVGTLLYGLVPPRLSGLALTALTERIYADDGIMGSGRAILICLKQRQWRLVKGPASLKPGGIEVSRSLLLAPVIAEFSGKFADSGTSLLLDTGQRINWRKQQRRHPVKAQVQTGLDLIDAENRGSLQDAQDVIAALNRSRAEGRADWRLPMVDEVQSLANYAIWSGMTVSAASPRKIIGLAWTGETDADGAPLAVDMASGNVVPLGSSGMYGALILPVAGHGWHASGNPPQTD